MQDFLNYLLQINLNNQIINFHYKQMIHVISFFEHKNMIVFLLFS